MLKKALLIYNPTSGKGYFNQHLDSVLDSLQYDYANDEDGYSVTCVRVSRLSDIERAFENVKDFDILLGSGGDGTINLIVDSIVRHNIDIPFTIIPSGTANDFASYLGLPSHPVEAVKLVHDKNITPVDIGMINDKPFVNVVAIGGFANVSSEINQEVKNRVGKLAYYVKSLERLTNMQPIKLKVKYDNIEIIESFDMVVILNSSGAGGLKNVSPLASIQDGKLDFVGFKTCSLLAHTKSFFDILSGNHVQDDNVVHFQSDKIEIEPIDDTKKIWCDVDGDMGPSLPVSIECLNKRLNVFI